MADSYTLLLLPPLPAFRLPRYEPWPAFDYEAASGTRTAQPPVARYPRCKPWIEPLVALVLLIVTAPVVLLAALAVRLTSRGPAFYRQTRLGRDGRPYTLYKLR